MVVVLLIAKPRRYCQGEHCKDGADPLAVPYFIHKVGAASPAACP